MNGGMRGNKAPFCIRSFILIRGGAGDEEEEEEEEEEGERSCPVPPASEKMILKPKYSLF
jgi:hypothetical protein